ALPQVADVEYSGPADASLTVVHVRDWHFVPKELADAEGLDFQAHLDSVEKVQADQLAIARFLIVRTGTNSIYSEGLSEESMPALRLRLELLSDMEKLERADALSAAQKEAAHAFPRSRHAWSPVDVKGSRRRAAS